MTDSPHSSLPPGASVADPSRFPPLPSQGHRQAVMAGFLGWTLDAFDFFLVVMAVPAIAKTFNQNSTALVVFSLTITLVFRPVGAFIFGLLADRYGRRLPLMADLIFFSIVEVLSGLAPNFTTFLILRALFGIGMGGEWGVGASLAMEKVPPLRGVLSGLLQEGYAAGYLLAALAYWFIFPRWGWRPLFFVGGLPALLALFVRFGVKESEVWEKTHHASFPELGRAIISHWKLFLYLVALMAMMNLSSHGTQDLYPTFLEKGRGLGTSAKSALTVLSMVGAIAGGVLFGLYSDRAGRRKAIVTSLLLGVLVVPLWALPTRLGLLIAGAFLLQFMVQGAWGVIPAHISELSPDSVRGFLPGFAYQLGNMIAAFVATFETYLVEKQHLSYSMVLACSAVTIFLIASLVAALGPERRGIRFAEEPQAGPGDFPVSPLESPAEVTPVRETE